MSIPIRLAADIGGTFTDVVLESEAGFQSTKVLTTLNQPEIGVMQGIDELLRLSNIEPGQITHVIHGTTLGTNTVIERKGAKTAFLTTEGFRGMQIFFHLPWIRTTIRPSIRSSTTPLKMSEYRQPPYLTAAGDLSDHLEENKRVDPRLSLSGDEKLQRLGTGSYWESVCGYSRAVKKGGRILVSGTTAIHGEDRVICRDDPRGQAVYILDKILSAVSALGGQRSDIVRTRVYLANQDHCESVSRVHGRYFEGLNPANTTIEVSNLIGDHLVEIEAEAIVDEG